MNRRRFLIALAVVVPVAAFVAAKVAASWRPVVVSPLLAIKGPMTIPWIAASSDTVFAGDEDSTVTRFDLTKQRQSKREIEGVCQGHRARWRLRAGAPPQLEIIRPDQTRAYPLSPQMARVIEQAARSNFVDGGLFLSSIRVLDGQEQLQLLVGERFCRWNQRTGQLEREFAYTDFDAGGFSVLARDGQSIIWAGHEVAIHSTRDGHLIKRFQWAALGGGVQQNSSFGAYSVYRTARSKRQQWDVADIRTGQRLWSVDWDVKRDIVFFSPDETMLAIARPALGLWHLHQTRDGALMRTLPLIPDAIAGAFAPDNATLYTIAKGVLYRQRAR